MCFGCSSDLRRNLKSFQIYYCLCYFVDCFSVFLDLVVKWLSGTAVATLKALELTDGHCTRWL